MVDIIIKKRDKGELTARSNFYQGLCQVMCPIINLALPAVLPTA
jgi:hypothetical protein